MYRRLLAVLIAGATLCPGLAQAAPTEAELNAARKLFEEAQAHEDGKRWIQALELLRSILKVKETAGIRFHMAVCEEHLGQLLAAEADYRRAIELAPTMITSDGPVIARRAEQSLEQLRPRIPRLTLRVSPDVKELTVEIDGKPLASDQLTRPLSFDPGEVAIRARAPGRHSFSQRLVLAEGDNRTVELTLPTEEHTTAAPIAPAPPVATASPRRWPAYVVGGASVAAAGVGVFFYLQHRRLGDETETRCNDPAWACDRAGRDDRLDDYKRYGLIAGGTAVVGLGVATYLFLSATPASASTALRVGPGGVSLAGRW